MIANKNFDLATAITHTMPLSYGNWLNTPARSLSEYHQALCVAGDAVFPDEVHCCTRCPKFAGDAVFPGEVHWGTRCPMFAGDAVFPVKFTGAQMPNVCRGCRIPR